MFNKIKGIIIIMLVFIIFPGIAGWYDTHYRTEAEIVAKENDVIILLDKTGNLWEYETDANFKIGEKVKVTFDNNYTDNVTDDIITQIKKF